MLNVSEALTSRSIIKSIIGDHVRNNNGFQRGCNYNSTLKLLTAPTVHPTLTLKPNKRIHESVFTTVNRLVKGKLRMGAKILEQVGGIDKVFRRLFSVIKEEELLKASRCCLYTTAGPIPGRLFISSHKLAFCSHAPVATASSLDGASLRFHYKIVIPMGKIKGVEQREKMKKATEKYMQVVTEDGFEFWFTGLMSNKKTLKCLQQALLSSQI